jgi:outer membrane protein OmpA-like peptidoglycan-associated protein
MGHTDNFGSEEYNLNLSQKRADFASDYLIETGVLNNRIKTSGYGDSKPVSNNVTAKGRLKNRRIEFLFHRL